MSENNTRLIKKRIQKLRITKIQKYEKKYEHSRLSFSLKRAHNRLSKNLRGMIEFGCSYKSKIIGA